MHPRGAPREQRPGGRGTAPALPARTGGTGRRAEAGRALLPTEEAAACGQEATRPGSHEARLWGGLGASRAGERWSGSAFFTCWALRASECPWDHGGVQAGPDSRICPNPCADAWGIPRRKRWGEFQPQCCLSLLPSRASVGPSVGGAGRGWEADAGPISVRGEALEDRPRALQPRSCVGLTDLACRDSF